jgi:ABC-type sugar transport system ATPase subunit
MIERDRVDTEIGALVIQSARQYEGDVVVGVRPEDVKLVHASADVENRFAGNVLATTFLGDQATAEVKIKDKIFLAKTLPDDAKPVGAVLIHLPKQKIVVFPEAVAERHLDYK